MSREVTPEDYGGRQFTVTHVALTPVDMAAVQTERTESSSVRIVISITMNATAKARK